MCRRMRIGCGLSALLALAAGLRIWACFLERPLHPDEFFQYLEPAWWQLTGSGLEAWEWRAGLRSWVLPLYHGGWMGLLKLLGVRDGPTVGRLLQLHWAVLNTSVVWIAWRGGCSVTRGLRRSRGPEPADAIARGYQGGFTAAALCAGFPLLVLYAGHSLSEMPSMLCLLAGLVWTAELAEENADAVTSASLRKAAWAGGWLSLGACLRIANGPLVLLPPLWLLALRRWRALFAMLAATLVPALGFGLMDLVTWDAFAASFINYLKFNLIEGKAANFGTQPAWWYVERLHDAAPLGLPLLLLVGLRGLRATWPYLLSAAWMVGYLSTQPHKEGRFLIGFWPLVLIAAGGTLGAWMSRDRRFATPARAPAPSDSRPRMQRRRWLARGVSVAFVLMVVLDASRDPFADYWLEPGRTLGVRWAGAQADLTGLMVDDPIFSAGSLWFGRAAPLLKYNRALLDNPIISHIVVAARSRQRHEAMRAGFVVVHGVDQDFVVLARHRR